MKSFWNVSMQYISDITIKRNPTKRKKAMGAAMEMATTRNMVMIATMMVMGTAMEMATTKNMVMIATMMVMGVMTMVIALIIMVIALIIMGMDQVTMGTVMVNKTIMAVKVMVFHQAVMVIITKEALAMAHLEVMVTLQGMEVRLYLMDKVYHNIYHLIRS